MSKPAHAVYEFGPFRVDASERLLLRDGKPVPLTPKVLDTLLVLVERSGRLVEKDELMKRLWPDTFVEEGALTRNISDLRKALSETSSENKYIDTVPKRGYRFMASVREISDASVTLTVEKTTQAHVVIEEGELAGQVFQDDQVELPHARPRTGSYPGMNLRKFLIPGLVTVVLLAAIVGLNLNRWKERARPAGVPTIRALAVLPLENLSGKPEEEYFADGMTEALIADLGKIDALHVISRTSVMQYKRAKKPLPQIGQELNVDGLIEGSVARFGDRVRVTARLIDAARDRQLWGGTYEEGMSDILALQSEVARSIAREIKVRLSARDEQLFTKKPQVQGEAYDAYLEGRYFWNQRTTEGFRKAIEYFQQALKKDPNYAPAYSGLADCHIFMHELPPTEVMPKAKRAALQALKIDDSLPEVHLSLARVKMFYDLDWSGAEIEIKRAIELNPSYAEAHHSYAFYLMCLGRLDDGYAENKRAKQLDPLSLIVNKQAALILYFQHRYDQAIEQYRKVLELDPNFPQALREIGLSYEQKGMYQEAVRALQNSLKAPGNYFKATNIADIGHVYAVWPKRTEAQKILDELQKRSKRSYVSPYDIAIIYAGLGEKDRALAWLNRAYEDRSFFLAWLKVDPRLESLRAEPGVADLLRRAGLAP